LSAKNYTVDNSIKVLRDYLKRNKIEGEVTEGLSPGRFRVRREIIGNPRVSIIIPFRDQVKILKRCVGSILRKTDYKNYEIVLANNQSQEKETLEYLEILKNDPACRVMNYDKPFNFSAINNYAVNWCGNEYVLFLNNDTEVIEPGWLSAMLEHIQREEVGAVGAKLLYPSGRIQHAGVVLGLGIAGHAFKHLPGENEGYMSQANIIRNCSAVTAACLLTKKSIFNEVGGFDERNFTVAYNDVDLCLRIREKGFLVIYTPYAKLYHHESLSRGDDEEVRKKNIKKYERVVAERKKMFKKWKKWILNDPYYNPNLTRIREDFSLKHENRPPRYL
jgi:GT2 family glycosyltransferase